MAVTRLELDGYITEFSDRDISENLSPISEAATSRRTVNGTLVSIANPAFQKLKISISGRDLHAPAFADLWPGKSINITPSTEITQLAKRPFNGWQTISYTDSDGITHYNVIELTLTRPIAEGSLNVKSISGNYAQVIAYSGNKAYITHQDNDLYLTYRPILFMMIEGWSTDESERNAEVSWSLEASEI